MRALAAIPAGQRAGTYVLSFFVYDERDDPRFPTLKVGSNTEADVADEIARYSTGPREARWNYACWRQNELGWACDSRADPDGAALREAWAREQGLWYEPADGEGTIFNPRGEPLTAAFIALLIEVVRRLHRDGEIERAVGRAIPVLIHELEYYDAIADQNLAANPAGLVPDEFVRFCRGEWE